MQLKQFLAGVAEIVNTNPTYKEGGDGSRGSCDCIGLIIGAIRRAGEQWPWTHGSNWTARNYMVNLVSPAPLLLGGIVNKYHNPGDPGYNLPAAYKDHPDQRDYYHVGVITSVSPLRITHCTGGTTDGIKVDTNIGAWRYGGRLKGVAYEEEQDMQETQDTAGTHIQAVIDCPPGETVKLRQAPSDRSVWYAKIPRGEKVEVLNSGGEWHRIQWGELTGYVMAGFVKLQELPKAGEGDLDGEVVQIPREAWDAFLEAFERVLKAVR